MQSEVYNVQALCVVLYIELNITGNRWKSRVTFKYLDFSAVLYYTAKFLFCYIIRTAEANISRESCTLNWSEMYIGINRFFREL